jgi:alanyl-tRNA synthetase
MFEMLGTGLLETILRKLALGLGILTEVLKERPFFVLKETIRECAFDQEAFDIWKQFVPEDRIILGNKKR